MNATYTEPAAELILDVPGFEIVEELCCWRWTLATSHKGRAYTGTAPTLAEAIGDAREAAHSFAAFRWVPGARGPTFYRVPAAD